MQFPFSQSQIDPTRTDQGTAGGVACGPRSEPVRLGKDGGPVLFHRDCRAVSSTAGFASLIAWLRDDSGTWDPINLWRVQNIVHEALTIVLVAMVVIPIFSITNDVRVTTRFGSVGLVLSTLIGVLVNRHPDPAIWVPRMSWTIYMTGCRDLRRPSAREHLAGEPRSPPNRVSPWNWLPRQESSTTWSRARSTPRARQREQATAAGRAADHSFGEDLFGFRAPQSPPTP